MSTVYSCTRLSFLMIVLGVSLPIGCGGPTPPPPIDAAVNAEIVKQDEMVKDQESSL